jgi:hypothetical protein
MIVEPSKGCDAVLAEFADPGCLIRTGPFRSGEKTGCPLEKWAELSREFCSPRRKFRLQNITLPPVRNDDGVKYVQRTRPRLFCQFIKCLANSRSKVPVWARRDDSSDKWNDQVDETANRRLTVLNWESCCRLVPVPILQPDV